MLANRASKRAYKAQIVGMQYWLEENYGTAYKGYYEYLNRDMNKEELTKIYLDLVKLVSSLKKDVI